MSVVQSSLHRSMNQQRIPAWNRDTLLRSPLFAPLQPIISKFESDDFPVLQDCNALLAAIQPAITVQNGMPLCFVPQEHGKLSFEAQYEPRCFLKGEVPTREHNWHDLFNALVWMTFPKTKSVLNARHYQVLLEERASGTSRRGALRDVNTLFDESGVIVVHSNAELATLLRDFEWKELFWRRREHVDTGMRFILFGHGLYEKALQPFVGMTGQGLLIAVEQEFFKWPQTRQLQHLDRVLADYLATPEHCCTTRELAPVPLLGYPGWSEDNARASYYDNTEYFRPRRGR